jgi:hypothetical protein
MAWYQDLQSNVFSQYGEDGILAEIFRRFGISSGYFVEFGAWDGIKYSNTYNLLKNGGWSGVYIEGDRERYADLLRNIPQSDVIKICEFVAVDGASSLDNILARHNVADNITLLSIDIDSDDYAVWEGVLRYSPTVVIVEYNPTIPLDVDYIQPRGATIGNSAKAIARLGASKGYELVAATLTNLIFVRNTAFQALKIEKTTLEELIEPDLRFRLFYGYDGSLVHAGPARFKGNPWQKGLPGQVPKLFRYYGSRGKWRDTLKRSALHYLGNLLR